ncbi:UbiX family flavin prenyltransferase [Pseudovibrio sp. SPO723]|uniref:UbiX family flavin prenyltransferase n=1 Tax=Nesiotobacter zosterae TaxID=392721 RepID=UPI0029C1B8A5|nr:UbiX family flavin prenyltransferase [Pseudovibrio sp. SPO723]MDX5592218.1 UbiX family flavin prenyltransferase [Pseudovibrio sp. SPO723]
MARRIVVGVTGASGAVLALETLKILESMGVDSRLVISKGADLTIRHELGEEGVERLKEHARASYDADQMMAPMASGSSPGNGMIIVPCSMRTLSAVAYGLGDSLLTRAADVTLKERRPLVLVTREAPLHLGHIEAMEKVTRMGGIICPPVPPFYSMPESLESMYTQIAARAVSTLGLDRVPALKSWDGE